jgi:peroxiredoxin
MNFINWPKRHLTPISLVLFGLFFFTTVTFAGDEDSIIADFQKSLRAADPKLAQETYMREHTNQPTEKEMEKLVDGLCLAAVNAMDRAAELERQYPQSKQLSNVRSSLAETLGGIFGNRALPIPQDRVDDVEVCIRRLLSHIPEDIGLYLALCNVAANLPMPKQVVLYQELSHEPTPEPARSKAQKALLDLERIGKLVALDFTAVDGRKVSLAELKGKVVLIDFWATTCLPCVRDLPSLKDLYTKYKPKGLEVIGISLDSDKEVLTRFIQKNELSWPQYFDAAGFESPFAKTYGIKAIPVIWLVDRQGLLRHIDASRQLEQRVETLLKEQ